MWIYYILAIHSQLDELLGCPQFGAVVINVARNFHMHLCVSLCLPSLGEELLGLRVGLQ